MIHDKKDAFEYISREWAILRYDIEHRQSINDQSLNNFCENFIRDLFNDLFDLNLENANLQNANAPYIDLIDKNKKYAIQVTSKRNKEKIEQTLKFLDEKRYAKYKLKIFYILEKAKPSKGTIINAKEKYGVDLKEVLLDSKDIMKHINNLQGEDVVNLYNKHFEKVKGKYTNTQVLNFAVRNLHNKIYQIKKTYDDSFGSVDINKKLDLNSINDRISSSLRRGSDYTQILENMDDHPNILTELREYIINKVYKEILTEVLSEKIENDILKMKSTEEIHQTASDNKCDFNKIIYKLHGKIESDFIVKNFDAMNIAWVIVAYFFEICDIGIHKK